MKRHIHAVPGRQACSRKVVAGIRARSAIPFVACWGVALALGACQPSAPKAPSATEEVPVNSAAERRASLDDKATSGVSEDSASNASGSRFVSTTSTTEGTPTGPSTAEGPTANDKHASADKRASTKDKTRSTGKAASASPAASPKSTSAAGDSAKASKAECSQLLDKYIELEVSTNPDLKGLGSELKGIIDSAKQQARQQKSDPCDEQEVTRAQYTCAMAARTPDRWKACLK